MVDLNQEQLTHQCIHQLLGTPPSAPVLSAAGDALSENESSSAPIFSPMEAEAFAAEYLGPRPSGSPEFFTASLAVINGIFLAPPAPTTPPAPPAPTTPPAPPARPADVPFLPHYAPNSTAAPSRAGIAAQSPAWGAVAAPPASSWPSHFLWPLLFGLPDASAAIAAAARLLTRSTRPCDVTLTSGLDASAGYSSFVDDTPEVKVFVNILCQVSESVPPDKLMTFLDGVRAAFRRERTEALQAQRPERSENSVSGSASEDSQYFERQILIPLTEHALRDVVTTNWGATSPYFSESQVQIIRVCRKNVDAGGGREFMSRIKENAKCFGAAVYDEKLVAMKEKLLADNNGRSLSPNQVKQARDAASAARSNKVRKQMHVLARVELMEMLVQRWELRTALPQIVALPQLSSRREIGPPRSR